jgi:hypothetical protein
MSNLATNFIRQSASYIQQCIENLEDPFLPQFAKGKSCLTEGRTKGHWSINSETLDNGWSSGSLELLNQ